MFEERLRLLEGAEVCMSTASGMGAVFASLMAQLKAGDRVVASRALFGSCLYIVAELLPRFGIETRLIDGTDLGAWKEALAPGEIGRASCKERVVQYGSILVAAGAITTKPIVNVDLTPTNDKNL